mmetsp:Transcript_3460/g.5136  ORF Transcript_3460/g.5136 Transcript_3460/m.5136 type:complete len:331 (+) Transcript_3460:32-1024(+)
MIRKNSNDPKNNHSFVGDADDASIHSSLYCEPHPSFSSSKQNVARSRQHPDYHRRSLWLQGLQARWRRTETSKVDEGDYRRTRIGRFLSSDALRLSRRMWLWTQHCDRWKTYQRCIRQISSRSGTWVDGRQRQQSIMRSKTLVILLLQLIFLLCPTRGLHLFHFHSVRTRNCPSSMNLNTIKPFFTRWKMTVQDDHDDQEEDLSSRPADNLDFDDLLWRVEKVRLEEANKQRFLKSGPRFLPYEQCRKWVQAWGNRWTSEEEWRQWIDTGEKRNAYIPAYPKEYYTKLGRWVSWEHFLGVVNTTSSNTAATTTSGSTNTSTLFKDILDWQ